MEGTKIYVALAALAGIVFIFFIYLQTDKELRVNNLVKESEALAGVHRQYQSSLAEIIKKTKGNIETAQRQVEEIEAGIAFRAKLAKARNDLDLERASVAKALGDLKLGLDAFLASFKQKKLPVFEPAPGKTFTDVTLKEVNRTGIVFTHTDGPARFALKDIAAPVSRKLNLDIVPDMIAMEAKVEAALAKPVADAAAKPAPQASAVEPGLPAPPPVANEAIDPLLVEDPAKVKSRQDVMTKIAQIDARIADLTRQMKVETDAAEAKDARLAHGSGRSVLSTANVNRENAKRISALIAILEQKKIELAGKLSQP